MHCAGGKAEGDRQEGAGANAGGGPLGKGVELVLLGGSHDAASRELALIGRAVRNNSSFMCINKTIVSYSVTYN